MRGRGVAPGARPPRATLPEASSYLPGLPVNLGAGAAREIKPPPARLSSLRPGAASIMDFYAELMILMGDNGCRPFLIATKLGLYIYHVGEPDRRQIVILRLRGEARRALGIFSPGLAPRRHFIRRRSSDTLFMGDKEP